MAALHWISCGVLVLSLWLATSLLWPDHGANDVEQTLKGLLAVRSQPPQLRSVAIGYNSNLDLIVRNAVDLFVLLHIDQPGPLQRDHQQIESLDELQETLSYWFARGSAVERFVSDQTLFKRIVQAAESLPESEISFFIGGNAALMAQRMALNGSAVFLGGRIGSRLAQLMDSRISLQAHPSEALRKDDEVHLILEYKKGTQWGHLIAPRANRLILVHDITNSQVLALEDFHRYAANISPPPQLYVIAGLHLLEGQTKDFRSQRLGEIVHHLKDIEHSIPIHFELASVGNPEYLRELASAILSEVDSMGLNEQELFALYKVLDGQKFSSEDFVSPTPAAVAQALTHIFSRSGERLSRIHFHSLEFHIIATQTSGKRLWEEEKSLVAVAAGSLAASFQACESTLTKTSAEVHLSSFGNNPVQNWRSETLFFALAPVLVCKKPSKTVGLGDIISATGLLYSY